MLNNTGVESKFNITLPINGTIGVIGLMEGYACQVETQLRLETYSVGATNQVRVYGRIRNSLSYTLIKTLVGVVSTTVDVTTYDFVGFDLLVADGVGSIVGSGFIFGGGGVVIDIALNFRGAYDAGTAYNTADTVTYLGSTYYNILSSTGNLPTNTTYWELLVSKGDDGATGPTGPTGPQGPAGNDAPSDHTLLSNIGTRTHDELEIDIAPPNSTGLKTGGVLSIGTGGAGVATTFTIALGTGVIADNTVIPATLTQISWTAKTDVSVTNIGTQALTFVAIDSGGNVIQSATDFNGAEHRQYIVIGTVVHTNLTTVTAVNQGQHLAISPQSQLNDLLQSLAGFNISGNVFSANGANLNINKSAGEIFKQGANYAVSANNPNIVSNASLTAASFRYNNQTGTASASLTAIDPSNYDLAGVTTAVAVNKFTVQRIFLFSSNLLAIQRGQAVYNSLADAKAGIQTESFIVNSSIIPNGILRGFLIVKQGTTTLNSATDAFFLEAPKFGGTSGVGGLSVSTLQGAYDNSVTPEVVTDATRGALTVQRGSAADTDSVFDVQNGAGTTTFGVNGNGYLTSIVSTSKNTTAPNATVPAISVSATSSESNIDIVLSPKGTGAILSQVPDNTTTGGNKRGAGAVDFQFSRIAATQVASGANSFASGIGNLVSGIAATGIGAYNTASSNYSVALGYNCWTPANGAVALGYSSTANKDASVAVGLNSTASGVASFVSGSSGSAFGIYGRRVHSGFILVSTGDTQKSQFPLCKSTTNATPAVMTADNGAASAINQVVLQNNNSFAFTGLIIVKQAGSTVTSSWEIKGQITRGANAAATTLDASSVNAISNATGITTPALSADTTNGALAVTVTGVAATTLRWSANVFTAEIISA